LTANPAMLDCSQLFQPADLFRGGWYQQIELGGVMSRNWWIIVFTVVAIAAVFVLYKPRPATPWEELLLKAENAPGKTLRWQFNSEEGALMVLGESTATIGIDYNWMTNCVARLTFEVERGGRYSKLAIKQKDGNNCPKGSLDKFTIEPQVALGKYVQFLNSQRTVP